MPTTPAIWEAETVASRFEVNLGKSYQDPISKISRVWWCTSVVPVIQEIEVRGLCPVQGKLIGDST
jgi:hypothetical protein